MYEHRRETEFSLGKKLLERSANYSIFYLKIIKSLSYDLQDTGPTVRDTTRERQVVDILQIVLKKKSVRIIEYRMVSYSIV